MLGPAATLIVSCPVVELALLVSVAVTVNVIAPAEAGVPLSTPSELNDRPFRLPLATQVQHVAVPSLSDAVKVAPAYGAVASPSGRAGTLITGCPHAIAANSNVSAIPPTKPRNRILFPRVIARSI